MSKKTTLKPLAIAAGTAFATSLAAALPANAADNPFAMSELSSGYMVAEMGEDKGAEKMEKEGKCGEGKGAEKMEKEGKCGEGKDAEKKMKMEKEGKCGEAKCGANK